MTDSHSSQRDEVLSLEHVRQLAELMQEFGLSELELRDEDQRIRLARTIVAQSAPPDPAGVLRAAAASGGVTADTAASSEPTEDHVVIIKSPMVGTYYNRANPDAEPYVRVGDHIGPDTIVCIIEAMKVFNEIPAEVSGRVIAVLVENEEPVDFDKPLLKIDTSG